MSQVLARKWRPKTFQDLVGQTHARQALSNALTQDRLHHAYLFSGARGVGKTTIARIFAKCLNCEQGLTETPCGTCDTCRAIDHGNFPDLIEVDAASRTKVDDTRELLDNAQYAPIKGRYKVYLIDEVHMLSTHSFNALLKTLEEPPKHIKFLLATTDPQKLPATILSRCLQFHLKLLTPEQIAGQLAHIGEKEGIKFTPESLNMLAVAAKGSLRDALSLYDQAIAFSNSNLTEELVRGLLGEVEISLVYKIIEAVSNEDMTSALKAIEQIAENGFDFTQVLDQMAESLHRIAMLQAIPEDTPLPFTSNDTERELSHKISRECLQLYYQITIMGRRDLPYSPSLRTGFEMVLLRLIAFKPGSSTPPQNNNRQKQRTAPQSSNQTTATKKPQQSEQQTEPQPKQEAVSQEPEHLQKNEEPKQVQLSKDLNPDTIMTNTTPNLELSSKNWAETSKKLGLKGLPLQIVNHSELISFNGEHLRLNTSNSYFFLVTKQQSDLIEQGISDYLGKKITVEIQEAESTQVTPAQVEKAEADKRNAEAEITMKNDDKLQNLIKSFDGSIVSFTPTEKQT